MSKIGLRGEYLTNDAFAVNVQHLYLTAFLPVEQVEKVAMNQLSLMVEATGKSRQMLSRKFAQYFRRTWLKLYKPQLWNVFKRHDRTSKSLERDNRAIKEFMTPGTYFYKFIEVLVQIDAEQTQEYHRLLIHQHEAFIKNKNKVEIAR